jgi:hypothetical protein
MIAISISMKFKGTIINKLLHVKAIILLLRILTGQLMAGISKATAELLTTYFSRPGVGNKRRKGG